MIFSIVTLFPDFFSGPLKTAQISRALNQGIVKIDLIALREFAVGHYGSVDDKDYGGGPGMVLKMEPLVSALESIQRQKSIRESQTGRTEFMRIVALTPRGLLWDQAHVQQIWGTHRVLKEREQDLHIVLICGRYQGFDQRFVDFYCDHEISIGPYIINGGEVAAWVLIESLSRGVEGFVGNAESLQSDSFSRQDMEGRSQLDWPHFTSPPRFRSLDVPRVLRSGHHQKIQEWRESESHWVDFPRPGN